MRPYKQEVKLLRFFNTQTPERHFKTTHTKATKHFINIKMTLKQQQIYSTQLKINKEHLKKKKN